LFERLSVRPSLSALCRYLRGQKCCKYFSAVKKAISKRKLCDVMIKDKQWMTMEDYTKILAVTFE
ncbi:hypothetical protein T10_8266, partial [Trichinella papuae]